MDTGHTSGAPPLQSCCPLRAALPAAVRPPFSTRKAHVFPRRYLLQHPGFLRPAPCCPRRGQHEPAPTGRAGRPIGPAARGAQRGPAKILTCDATKSAVGDTIMVKAGWGGITKGRCVMTITQLVTQAQAGSRAAFGVSCTKAWPATCTAWRCIPWAANRMPRTPWRIPLPKRGRA